MKPLQIKLSSLDVSAPPGVEVWVRLTERLGGRSFPVAIGTYRTVEEAQKASDELTRLQRPHGYVTFWKRDGKHVKKWPTMMTGKRRHFRVSVPYVQGVADDDIKRYIHEMIVSNAKYITRRDGDVMTCQAEYTASAVTVAIDTARNKADGSAPLVVEALKEWRATMPEISEPQFAALVEAVAPFCERAPLPTDRASLQAHIQAIEGLHGGLRKAARALGIDPGYLQRMRDGDKVHPSKETLDKLGLVRFVEYRIAAKD